MNISNNPAADSLSPQITRDYNIIRLIGKGGMGDVYLAEQLRVGRRLVALKVLNRACCENPDIMRRFENEAASAGRIHHRNVVMIYESRITDDGQLYVAMEYVEGSDLGHEIEQRGSLPLDEVVDITKQVSAGLSAAHKLGIVHRDIKPANIMLTRDDEGALVVKVLDFGIARLSEPGSSGAQTKTGVVMGTPDYMSPEQTLGQTGDKIDRRSDIYSLAMVVNKMLTGRVAFEGDSWVQVMYKHINEAPQAPSKSRPELAHIALVDQVVLKGLEKDRERRQQSATDFAAELAAAYSRLKSEDPSEGKTMMYPGSGGDEGMPFGGETTVPPINETVSPSAAVTAPMSSAPANTREIGVATTSSSLENEYVTVADKQAASLEPISMSAQQAPPSAPMPAAATGKVAPRSSKKIAVAAVALVAVLAAGGYFAFRGNSGSSQQAKSESQAPVTTSIAPTQETASAQSPNAVPPGAVSSTAKANKNTTSTEAKKESVQNTKQEPAQKNANTHEASAPPPVAAPVEETTTPGETCLGIFVTRVGGSPVKGARVMVIDESTQYQGQTGPKGVWRRCGWTAGHRVSVRVLGPDGSVIGSKEMVLRSGGNPFKIQLP